MCKDGRVVGHDLVYFVLCIRYISYLKKEKRFGITTYLICGFWVSTSSSSNVISSLYKSKVEGEMMGSKLTCVCRSKKYVDYGYSEV